MWHIWWVIIRNSKYWMVIFGMGGVTWTFLLFIRINCFLWVLIWLSTTCHLFKTKISNSNKKLIWFFFHFFIFVFKFPHNQVVANRKCKGSKWSLSARYLEIASIAIFHRMPNLLFYSFYEFIFGDRMIVPTENFLTRLVIIQDVEMHPLILFLDSMWKCWWSLC